MSTGFECDFYEVETGKWYYLLQDWNCPVGCWSWEEYATPYGPFTSRDKADEHLRDNHANPGGSTTYNPEDCVKMSASDSNFSTRLEGARK